MMDIGVVRMSVAQSLVGVSVRVRFARRRRGVVVVLVVLVVLVPMLVFHPLVDVLVLVALADMKPDANQHERGGQSEPRGDGLIQHDHADHGANKRRC